MSTSASQTETRGVSLGPFQQLAASSSTAIITSFVVTPFDVIKTRLQAQDMPARSLAECCTVEELALSASAQSAKDRGLHFKGTWDAVLKISRHEGLANLWRGLGSTLTMSVPNTAIYLTAYEHLKVYMHPAVAGAAGRTLACIVVAPLELVRTNLQAQALSDVSRPNAGSILARYCRERGVLGLWRGLGPTLFRDVPFSAIYWFGYETLKTEFNNELALRGQQHPFAVPFAAGATSGMFAAAITTPFDVLKTRMQVLIEPEICLQPAVHLRCQPPKTVKHTMFSLTASILQKEGLSSLFTGLVPRVLKVAPACALVVGLFEGAKRYFKALNASAEVDGHIDS